MGWRLWRSFLEISQLHAASSEVPALTLAGGDEQPHDRRSDRQSAFDIRFPMYGELRDDIPRRGRAASRERGDASTPLHGPAALAADIGQLRRREKLIDRQAVGVEHGLAREGECSSDELASAACIRSPPMR
jgi:hypothetical protein